MLQRTLSPRSLSLPVLILVLVAVACVLWPTLLQAHGPIQALYSFYSEPAHVTKVGERIVYCDRHLEQYGTQTPYWTVQSFRCP